MRAMIEGRTYDIPEYWMIGATRSLGSPLAALRQWHQQALLAEEWAATICGDCGLPCPDHTAETCETVRQFA